MERSVAETPAAPGARAIRLPTLTLDWRRALGGAGGDETGDASLIFVEGDVSLQSAGRSTFDPARQRQALFDGDFIKTGRTGSAEIMFTDGTLYTIRPGSLFEVRRPTSSESSGSQVKMVSGAISVYTAAGTSTIATDAATASVGRESRVNVDVEVGERTEVTTFRGEIFPAPRSWVETVYPGLAYFNEVDRGGHFAAWEEPALFASEVRAAFKPLR